MNQKPRPLLKENDEIDHYSVLKLIQKGGFGEIYKVFDNQDSCKYSMKIEKIEVENPALEREIEINKLLHSKSFPQYIDSGQTERFRYLVQELCGPSFSQIRKIMPEKHFSLSTVLHIGIEMLKVIQEFHGYGYIHCDIKPGNFLLRPDRAAPVVLIDFGLSRRYYDPTSCPEPISTPFVGTIKYASINVHQGRELGRRDDLYSWFYSLIEMKNGDLPWTNSMKHQEALNAKTMIKLTELTKGFPAQMKKIYEIIKKLNRDEHPNYDLIISLMLDAMKILNIKLDTPFDWEHFNLAPISQIPLRYTDSSKIVKSEELGKSVKSNIEIDEQQLNAD